MLLLQEDMVRFFQSNHRRKLNEDHHRPFFQQYILYNIINHDSIHVQGSWYSNLFESGSSRYAKANNRSGTKISANDLLYVPSKGWSLNPDFEFETRNSLLVRNELPDFLHWLLAIFATISFLNLFPGSVILDSKFSNLKPANLFQCTPWTPWWHNFLDSNWWRRG